MKKLLILIFLFFSLIMIAQEDFLQSIKKLQPVYDKLNFSSVKISILDAVKKSEAKEVIACYLNFSSDKLIWIVLTPTEKFEISSSDAKILKRSPVKISNHVTYPLSLQNAVSLAILSIGKDILFSYPTDEGWIVGSKSHVAAVSMKTAVVIWVKPRSDYFESLEAKGVSK